MIRKPWIGTFATVLLLCAVSRPGTARGEAPGVPFIPKEAKALASRGEKAFAGGHLKEARVLYKEALDFGPSNPRVLVSLAAVETRMGNLPESERLLRQALSLDLRNGAAWLLLGMNQLELKRDEEAFASLGSTPRSAEPARTQLPRNCFRKEGMDRGLRTRTPACRGARSRIRGCKLQPRRTLPAPNTPAPRTCKTTLQKSPRSRFPQGSLRRGPVCERCCDCRHGISSIRCFPTVFPKHHLSLM